MCSGTQLLNEATNSLLSIHWFVIYAKLTLVSGSDQRGFTTMNSFQRWSSAPYQTYRSFIYLPNFENARNTHRNMDVSITGNQVFLISTHLISPYDFPCYFPSMAAWALHKTLFVFSSTSFNVVFPAASSVWVKSYYNVVISNFLFYWEFNNFGKLKNNVGVFNL